MDNVTWQEIGYSFPTFRLSLKRMEKHPGVVLTS